MELSHSGGYQRLLVVGEEMLAIYCAHFTAQGSYFH